jgi:hypothetical protein
MSGAGSVYIRMTQLSQVSASTSATCVVVGDGKCTHQCHHRESEPAEGRPSPARSHPTIPAVPDGHDLLLKLFEHLGGFNAELAFLDLRPHLALLEAHIGVAIFSLRALRLEHTTETAEQGTN